MRRTKLIIPILGLLLICTFLNISRAYPNQVFDPEQEITEPNNTSGAIDIQLSGYGALERSDSPTYESRSTGYDNLQIPSEYVYDGKYQAKIYPTAYINQGTLAQSTTLTGNSGTFTITGSTANFVDNQEFVIGETRYTTNVAKPYSASMSRGPTACCGYCEPFTGYRQLYNGFSTSNTIGVSPSYSYANYLTQLSDNTYDASYTNQPIESGSACCYGICYQTNYMSQTVNFQPSSILGGQLPLNAYITKVEVELAFAPCTHIQTGPVRYTETEAMSVYADLLASVHGDWDVTMIEDFLTFTPMTHTATGYNYIIDYFGPYRGWTYTSLFGSPDGYGTNWYTPTSMQWPTGVPYWLETFYTSYAPGTITLEDILRKDVLGNPLDVMTITTTQAAENSGWWGKSGVGFSVLEASLRLEITYPNGMQLPTNAISIDGQSNYWNSGASQNRVNVDTRRDISYLYPYNKGATFATMQYSTISAVIGDFGYTSSTTQGTVTYSGYATASNPTYWLYETPTSYTLEDETFYNTVTGIISQQVSYTGSYNKIEFELELTFMSIKHTFSSSYSSSSGNSDSYSLGAQTTLSDIYWQEFRIVNENKIRTLDIDSSPQTLSYTFNGYTTQDRLLYDSYTSLSKHWDMTSARSMTFTYSFDPDVPNIHKHGVHDQFAYKEYQGIPFNATVEDDQMIDVTYVIIQKWDSKCESIISETQHELYYYSGMLYNNSIGLSHGNYTYYYGVQDCSGNYNTTKVYELNLTQSFPDITFTSYPSSYENNTVGNQIKYKIKDDLFADSYNLTRNGTHLITNANYISDFEYTLPIDPTLKAGYYNYTITANNTNGRYWTEQILILAYNQPVLVAKSSNVTYYETSGIFDIWWNFIDDNPNTYIVTRNGTPVGSGTWNSGINIQLSDTSSLADGHYVYECTVTDNHSITADAIIGISIVPWPPRISDMPNGSVFEGDEEPFLEWTIEDTNLDSWWITILKYDQFGTPYEEILKSGTATTTTEYITYYTKDLTIGVHVITVYANDTRGNLNYDISEVTVKEPPPTVQLHIEGLLAWVVILMAATIATVALWQSGSRYWDEPDTRWKILLGIWGSTAIALGIMTALNYFPVFIDWEAVAESLAGLGTYGTIALVLGVAGISVGVIGGLWYYYSRKKKAGG